MAKVTFLARTITGRGRFEIGDVGDFTEDEIKDLQRLGSIKVSTPTVKKAKEVKKEKKEELKDEFQE